MRELYNKLIKILGLGLIKMILTNIKDYSKDPQGSRDKLECKGQVAVITATKKIVLHFTGYAMEGLIFDGNSRTIFVKRVGSNGIWIKPGPIKKEKAEKIFESEFANLSEDHKKKMNAINLLVRNSVAISRMLVKSGQLKPEDFKHQCFKELVCGKKEQASSECSYNTAAFKSVMEFAHHIRKAEKLEGHYHVQMKMALAKAHAIWNSEDIKVCCSEGAVVVQINNRKVEPVKTPTTTLEETEEFMSSVMKTFMKNRKFKFYYRTKAFKIKHERKGVEYINSIPKSTTDKTPC